MSLYATLDQTKRISAAFKASPQRTDYDPDLYEAIEATSREVDAYFYADRPIFAPYIETWRTPVNSTQVNSSTGIFRIGRPLLELTAVNASGNALTVGSGVSAYSSSNTSPYTGLRLDPCTAGIASWYSGNCEGCSGSGRYVDISGTWGVHPNYAQAWYAADALAANLDADDLEFTVADSDGQGRNGITPRFSPGNIIKIGSEIMNVIRVNDGTNTITIAMRGDNGSTAAAHTSAATVYTWTMPPDLRRAVSRQAMLSVSRYGSYVTRSITESGETAFPQGWLWELKNRLQRYVYDL